MRAISAYLTQQQENREQWTCPPGAGIRRPLSWGPPSPKAPALRAALPPLLLPPDPISPLSGSP